MACHSIAEQEASAGHRKLYSLNDIKINIYLKTSLNNENYFCRVDVSLLGFKQQQQQLCTNSFARSFMN